MLLGVWGEAMSEHTDGKLFVKHDESPGVVTIRDKEDWWIADVIIHNPEISNANARRLVAAWNAVDGIPTEDLERKVVVGFMADLKRQRDEAVAMLRRYRDETPLGHQPHTIAHEVDAFLAHLEGK
jgi:hypothetical protein